jgi:hypothetical protein
VVVFKRVCAAVCVKGELLMGAKSIIKVKIFPFGSDFRGLCFDETGEPIMEENAIGANHRLEVVYPDIESVKAGVVVWFEQKFDLLYPNGWVVEFEENL